MMPRFWPGLKPWPSVPSQRWPAARKAMAIGLCAGFAFACQTAPANSPPPAPAAKAEDEGHEHAAPHGGSLVEFGEEFAHLELVLDSGTGTLTAYALDGEAEQPVRLSAASIDLDLTPDGATTPLRVALTAIDNPLTGERVGDTSQFRALVAALKGHSRFRGRVVDIRLRGQQFTNVDFEFPAEH